MTKRITSLPTPVPPQQEESSSSSLFVYDLSEFPNESLFENAIHYPALSVPVQETANIRNHFKNHLLKGVKNVYIDDADSSRRIVVLKLSSPERNVQDSIQHYETECASLFDEILHRPDVHWYQPDYKIVKPYKDQSAEDLLRKLLPSHLEVPTGYERVGTILHVNLRDDLLPFKYWIGKIFLDTHTNIQTVVNKTSEINNTFRTFNMEVIAGDDTDGWSITEIQEHGCVFTLDYKAVYWNSRLAGEHQRLVQLIATSTTTTTQDSVVVADVMAGIGPFAIPLAKYPHITVFANDLNPASYQYLQVNAKANGCQNNMQLFNLDARDFIYEIQKDFSSSIDHVIMNLPASAPEFLDAFRGWKLSTFPWIHVHCFAPKPTENSTSSSSRKDIVYQTSVKRCEAALGCRISNPNIHVVRNVAPNKNMLCVSFRLPIDVADLPEVNTKRRRMN
jgi:tRNA (guanine37-N1)-methyltransferase